MASGRANFATEFLLRELLSALGAPLITSNTNNVHTDSFYESLSEDTESQSALKATYGAQSRVMLVRRTNSSQQTITLVDREYDVEAFISTNVMQSLQQERGYRTLGRLCGSVVRVTKYHFATLTRCLATCQQNRETSVSVPNVSRNKARVYLWADDLSIVEDNDLAVKALPLVYTHPLVAERLQTLSDAQLEKQLMINQGLSPFEASKSDRFDDDRPLLEEDCVIPEEQEQELEEQDEWGPPTTIERQPTDSELIEENGSVPMTEFQAVHDLTSPDKSLPTQESIVSSVTLSENPSSTVSEEMSVTPSLDSQRYLFQQENIRETFVVGSDSESSDTDSERVQQAKKSTPSTPKSDKQLHFSRKHSDAYSTIRNTPQTSWVVVDLTENSPEKAPMAIPASKKKVIEEPNSTTKANGLQNVAGGNAAPPPSAHAPPRTNHPTEKKTPSAGWATSLLRMVGLGTAEASVPHTQSSDKEAGDVAENDQNATQIVDQTEEKGKEAESAQPEDLISSQTTVILQYDIDDDDDAHAFEYEGMSDDMVSPRSTEHRGDQTREAGSAGDLSSTEERAEIALTPKKRLALKENTTSTDVKTPSPSAQAATPGTEKRTEPADCQTPTMISNLKEYPEMLARDSSHPACPLSRNDPVLPIDPAHVKSPSELAISVGTSSSRTGFSAVGSRGIKRRRQQTNAEYDLPSIIVQAELPVSQPRVQKDDRLRSQTQKHRRRENFSTQAVCMAGSESPQFEQPVFPRQPLQSDSGNDVTDCYSLTALCRSLGPRIRDPANEEDQVRTSRQPRRVWKRYENLFPPLNMTRLKHTMAERKDKCRR